MVIRLVWLDPVTVFNRPWYRVLLDMEMFRYVCELKMIDILLYAAVCHLKCQLLLFFVRHTVY